MPLSVSSTPIKEEGAIVALDKANKWCEDWYGSEQTRILRGASWLDYNEGYLLASYRSFDNRDKRQGNIGFRCVLAVEYASRIG